MSEANKNATFSLKVMVNKEEAKVLFAEVDNSFVHVLLSFLTLPLGMIVRILKKHYGDEAPVFGSLNSLYNGLEDLDSVHFCTQGAKSTLLHSRSSCDNQCKRLNIKYSSSLKYLVCAEKCPNRCIFQSVSMFIDQISLTCGLCEVGEMIREVNKRILSLKTKTLLITHDLQIHYNVAGLIQSFSVVGCSAATDKAEVVHITFGYAEVMDLLKASLISLTPLSDVIFNKTRQIMNSTTRSFKERFGNPAAYGIGTGWRRTTLNLIVQKSTKKLLYALAEVDFVEFLFGFLVIPLGRVGYILANNISTKSIDNLYKSASDIKENRNAKRRLINPHYFSLRSDNIYLKGPQTYKVMDDLTMTPFCSFFIFSSFSELNVPLSDVEVLNVTIGMEEV